MFELFGFSVPLIYIHLGTFALLVPLILFADHQGFEWLTGHKETLHPKTIGFVHNLTGAGLALMILSGLFLAWPIRDALFTNTAFLVKMGFVLLLIVNSYFIGKLMHTATERPFKSLSDSEKLPLFISGALSTIGWAGAFIAALYMGFGNLEEIFNSLF